MRIAGGRKDLNLFSLIYVMNFGARWSANATWENALRKEY